MSLYKKIGFVVAMSFALAACGGGGDDSSSATTVTPLPSNNNNTNPDNNTNTNATAYKLKTFAVTGTSASDTLGKAPISPTVNMGEFALDWSLQNNETMYKMSLFVSFNDTLSDTDIPFYSKTCGGVLVCGQKGTDSFKNSCFFNNQNEIYCSGGESNKANLTTFLTSLPKDAFLIAKSCDMSGLEVNCVTKAQAVQFQ